MLAAGTLTAGWLVTQRISADRDLYRKRRELDLAAVTQFYSTYGECFAISKIWTTYPRVSTDGAGVTVQAPPEERRALLKRASAMEGALEALLVKFAVERRTEEEDRVILARFREGL